MDRMRTIMAGTVAVLLLAAGQGCTVIGYSVGSSLDRTNTKFWRQGNVLLLYEAQPGDSVRAVLRSGRHVIGTLQSTGVDPEDMDVARLLARRIADPGIPGMQVGDTVQISLSGTEYHDIVFLGADSTSIWYHRLRHTTLGRLNIAGIRSMRNEQLRLDPPTLQDVLDSRLAGVYTMRMTAMEETEGIPMELSAAEGTIEIPMEQIADFAFKRNAKAMPGYTAAGVLLDIVMALAILAGMAAAMYPG